MTQLASEVWKVALTVRPSGGLVFSWPLDPKTADALAKGDPELRKARRSVVNIGGSHLVQLLDAATGTVKTQRIVEGVTLPWFETADAGGTALRPGDYLLAASTDNRLVIERWSDGAPVARISDAQSPSTRYTGGWPSGTRLPS